MKISVPSLIISIIVVFTGLIILPMYYISVVQWRNDYESIHNEARNLVDKIIDTREYTATMEEDISLAMATLNNTFTAKVTREVKVVNPDGKGGTYTTYITTDNNKEYAQGDFVTVTIEQLGVSPWQAISMRLLGINSYRDKVVYSGRVR